MNFAHVKWFVENDEIVKFSKNNFSMSDSFALGVWLLVLAIIAAAYMIDRKAVSPPKKWMQFVSNHKKGILRAFSVLFGVFMICTGLMWNFVLSPEIVADANTFTQLLRAFEVALGVLFVVGFKPYVSAIGLVVLYVLCGFVDGMEFWLENLLIAGSAIFLLIQYAPKQSWLAKKQAYAVPVARITTGISLVVMAFTEKLLHPEMSLQFLSTHHWNILANLGLSSISDERFVLIAGAVELLFGVLFILGVLTRVSTIAIGSIFGISVVTMLVSTGKWEVEDLPVYALAVILLAYGSGSRWRVGSGKDVI